MTDIQHRTLKANGINLRIAEAGSGPLVLMAHGFPESWYSYRHQLPALASAGYHAVAVDVRGYGGSDKPHAVEAYSMKQMTADMAGIVDALGEGPAVIVGHDWGAPIAWTSCVLYPERFRAVAAMSVPFSPRGAAPPTQVFKAIFKEQFFYILYFQEPGVAEAELEADARRSLRTFMYAASGDAPQDVSFWLKPPDATFLQGLPDPGDALPAWLAKADLDYFAGEFEASGFRGPLNRYRNMDRDWEELPQLAGAKVMQPALFIAGDLDGVIRMNPAGVTGLKQHVPNLTKTVMLPGCGHWTQQERPAEVNAELLAFLKEL